MTQQSFKAAAHVVFLRLLFKVIAGARSAQYLAAVIVTICILACAGPSKIGQPSGATDDTWTSSSQPPRPVGGIAAIMNNLVYPEEAKAAGIAGTVIVKAFIDSSGKVTKTAVLQGLSDTGLNDAAVEAVKNTPWIPAQQGGYPLAVWVKVPLKFSSEGFPIGYDKAPEPIGGYRRILRNLHYPPGLQNAGVEGMVIVQAYVDSTGRVTETIISKNSHPALDAAAAKAVEKTRFKPAERYGEPVGVWIAVPVDFRLRR